MQHLPALAEHEVCVVNTFVEFRDTKQLAVGRAKTAPALDASEVDETLEDTLQRSQKRAQTVAAVKAGEKLEDHHVHDDDFLGPVDSESEEEKEVQHRVSRWPSHHKMKTPEPWELDQMLADIREGAKKLIRRSSSGVAEAVVSQQSSEIVGQQPSLRRITTPDLWDRQMVEAEATAARSQASQVQATQPQLGPGFRFPQLSVPMLLVPPVFSMQEPGPRLLGRTSPAASPNRADVTKKAPLAPGALECQVSESKLPHIRWSVDGSKLQSNAENVLSPDFELTLPGVGPQRFRLMISATRTGGKHGGGFKKARGRGGIFAKCLSSIEGAPKMTLRATLVRGRANPRTETIEHCFSEKSCCEFQKSDEHEWDFKGAIKKVNRCFEISVEVVEYAR